GIGEKGKLALTTFLSKLTYKIKLRKSPDTEVPDAVLRRMMNGSHPTTLNWNPSFADRFTAEEAETLWDRFRNLDVKLQAPKPYLVPGFQNDPSQYHFEVAPAVPELAEIVASW